MFLKDPGLVILDEASSRLDPATEARIDRAVEHLLGAQGTVELAVLVGYYALLAYVMAALEVELEPEMPPLLPQ